MDPAAAVQQAPHRTAAASPVPQPSPPTFHQPVLSTGLISSEHIRWVSELRSNRAQWFSEVHGPWTPAENDYFEFTYELFHSGLLFGVEVGLPVRFFLSELLGCSVHRIIQKLMDDKRIPELLCPPTPLRELSDFERRALSMKLVRLEMAFLARERKPLKNRVLHDTHDAPRFRYADPLERDMAQNALDPHRHPTLAPRSDAAAAAPSVPSPALRPPPAANAAQPASDATRPPVPTPWEKGASPVTVGRSSKIVQPPPLPPPPREVAPAGPVTPPALAAHAALATPAASAAPTGTTTLQQASPAQPSPEAARPTAVGGSFPVAQRNGGDTPPLPPANGGTPKIAAGAESAAGVSGVVAVAVDPNTVSGSLVSGESATSAPKATTKQAAAPLSESRPRDPASGVALATQLQPPPPAAAAAAAAAAPLPDGGGIDGEDGMRPTTSYVDPRGKRHPYNPSPAVIKRAGGDIALEQDAPVTPTSSASNLPSLSSASGVDTLSSRNNSAATGGLQGRELGRQLLGVRKRRSSGEEPPRQKRRVSGNARPQPQGHGSTASGGHDVSFTDSPEDMAAMEYLKWELHGKFMAFPGEHYHNLLASLASEIYHNRYPVEHGVDILHGVMRDAGPEALQKSAAALKRRNLPTRMML